MEIFKCIFTALNNKIVERDIFLLCQLLKPFNEREGHPECLIDMLILFHTKHDHHLRHSNFTR